MDATAAPCTAAAGLALSAVMPVFNGAAHLGHTLPPLLALLQRGELVEVLVVDDGSTDGTAAVAAALGATVLHTGGRHGPAAARNLGARQASGELLWFVDADVVVRPDAVQRLRHHFQAPELMAVFGSYCDAPPAPGFFAQYKNLVHHFRHQRAAGRSSSFWAGCGAVRRDVLLATGGFDAGLFSQPSIEDVEFGHRLARGGARIELDPGLLCTHLKQWRAWQLVRTDILHRALPWSRLMLAGRAPAQELNVDAGERRAAALALLLLLSLALAPHPAVPAALPLAPAAAALFANRALLGFLRRRRGLAFAAAAALYHQVFYVYSAATYGWCWLERLLGAGPSARPARTLPAPLRPLPAITPASPAANAQRPRPPCDGSRVSASPAK